MVQGYYTLQEASDFLDMPVDELKQMAQKGKIRSFQDRGTLRFRIQDIQELGRSRGAASEPELVLGDASLSPPKSAAAPSSGKRKAPAAPKSPKSPAPKDAPEVFAFDLEDSVDLGSDIILPKSGAKSKSGLRSGKRPASPPIPSAGSDSEIRLVADGSDVTFAMPKSGSPKVPDSDVKISSDPLKPRTGLHPSPSSKRKSQLATESGPKSKPISAASGAKPVTPKPASGQQPIDSGVRLVPLSDSDVKLLGSSDDVPLGGDDSQSGATDSNVRLEKVKLPPADSGEGMLTEEINLDEEIRKQHEKEKTSLKQTSKLKPKSELKFPTSSPFELSDSDLEMPSELKSKSGPKTPAKSARTQDDSSDFELEAQSSPTADGSSDFDLLPASDDGMRLDGDSSDFDLQAKQSGEGVLDDERSTELNNSTSGISLDNPVDQGISLEDGASDDFDLSLEVEDTPKPSRSLPIEDSSDFEMTSHKTPRPGKHVEVEDSASDFDLSLDSDLAVPSGLDDSSFDLNLEGSGDTGGESDSEFELTLDDSGNLAIDDETPAPQVKAKKGAAPDEEADIFESDFEVPALEGSDEATIADSESSDFDLALDDSELAPEEESGSQVVALDDEETDTLVDADGAVSVEDIEVEEESSDFQDFDQDVEVEVEGDEAEPRAKGKVRVQTVVKEKLIEPAPWGIVPVLFMLPCVIVMFMVALLGYEMVQTTTTLKPAGPFTVAVADMLGQKIGAK